MPGSKRIAIKVTVYASAPETAVIIAERFCRTVDNTVSICCPDVRQDQVDVTYELKENVTSPHRDDITIVASSLDQIDCGELLLQLERQFRTHRHAGAHGIVQVAFLVTDMAGGSEWDRKYIPAAPETEHSTTP